MAAIRRRSGSRGFCNVEASQRSVVVMKRLLAWFLGGVALAGLLLTLWLPGAAQAADLRNVADDKIAESAGKVDLNLSLIHI